ncbi:hypothetical protein E2C01_066831 [Portunus trituberculatus]|uniref:Uncharacterized protein n=1 Tax=Portunus trituberculatus TaxID=210409 RepID=A0A5B7HI70_PORTR|nr:hypothetical protein [Portunus trituberculatus]
MAQLSQCNLRPPGSFCQPTVGCRLKMPPVRLSVEWWMGESGDKERDGVVGLFHEGQAPTLICETRNVS